MPSVQLQFLTPSLTRLSTNGAQELCIAVEAGLCMMIAVYSFP